MQPDDEQDEAAAREIAFEFARREAWERHEAFFAAQDKDEELREWRRQQAEAVTI